MTAVIDPVDVEQNQHTPPGMLHLVHDMCVPQRALCGESLSNAERHLVDSPEETDCVVCCDIAYAMDERRVPCPMCGWVVIFQNLY